MLIVAADRIICSAFLALALLIGPALSGNAALAQDADEEEFQYPAYDGPRKTIAVANFDAIGAFVAQYGGWDIGGGVAAMLVSELQKTNRFVVVERAELDTLLREKELGLSDVTDGRGSSAQLLGVQMFVAGSVTEFSQKDKGGGLNLGLNVEGFRGGGGMRTATGKIAMDLRMIDAGNGAILSTQTVSEELKAKSLALQGGRGIIALGGDQFNRTALGTATRKALRKAVMLVIAEMEAVPWQGLVARVDGNLIYINAGEDVNLRAGQTLLCIRTINTITDPVTGEVLGTEQATIGEIRLNKVEARYSVGEFAGTYPARLGDTVMLKGSFETGR